MCRVSGAASKGAARFFAINAAKDPGVDLIVSREAPLCTLGNPYRYAGPMRSGARPRVTGTKAKSLFRRQARRVTTPPALAFGELAPSLAIQFTIEPAGLFCSRPKMPGSGAGARHTLRQGSRCCTIT